jgi:beta-lactamase superfamily II metal-dependent hydrolase
MKRPILFLLFLFISGLLFSQEKGNTLPAWKQGEMEIHHIYTGRGEAAFCIFPDGTTMIIDAGDIGPYTDPRTPHLSPDESRHAGEWIARYILKRLEPLKQKSVDYMFLTHIHDDHMGGAFQDYPVTKKGGDYILSGITEVGEFISFGKMIDRGWPEYNYPSPLKGNTLANYKKFVQWNIDHSGMKTEQFIPGADKQFMLVKNPSAYKDLFSIRNIVSNGEVWTGTGDQTKHLFPEGATVDENKCSAGIRISYGAFDYFNGGDLSGRLQLNTPAWRDIETPVGQVVGPVEVCEVNHHAYVDAMTDSFIASVQPQVFVVQVWNTTHLSLNVLQSMISRNLYPGDRNIFMTFIPEVTRQYLGEENMKNVSGSAGHIVIKVAPGGKQFSVIQITPSDESGIITGVYGPYICK